MIRYVVLIFVFMFGFFKSNTLQSQPSIDGIFDGIGTWGNAIATPDGAEGWAGANIGHLYVTYDATYVYFGIEINNAADWQSWGIVIDRNANGGNSEVWGYPITYGHGSLPDLIIKGHFGQGGTPYAEIRDWNGSVFQRKDNDGNDSGLSTMDFYSEETGMVEVRLKRSTFGNPSTGNIQAYFSGNVQSDHATFDACPDDDVASDWIDATILDHYINNIDLGGTPMVMVLPMSPTIDEQVVIQFDASNTALSGASKIYLHSGVSITHDLPINFDLVKGNWGNDDGIGEMTNLGGDQWGILITSLRSYFDVPITEDGFGLNFLFRNEDGTIVEDQGGMNFFEDVNPGFYFVQNHPEGQMEIVESGTIVDCSFESIETADTWTLDEVDSLNNLISNIANGSNSNVFMHNVSIVTSGNRYFRITAQKDTVTKYKNFRILGYDPVQIQSRPTWVVPGINYHENDSSKVTLVLHAPTYTRFFKHPQGQPPQQVGSNNTSPKNVVFVVGDFNNWQPSENYKMYRDTDGWDEQSQTDSDNDGDHGDYWWIELSDLNPNQEYVFQYLTGEGIQIGDPYAEQVSDFDDQYISNDRFPNLVPYPSEAIDRAAVLQNNIDTFNWQAQPFNAPSINNLNVYELHFRDFTEEGTYLAAIDKLDYIKALGINAIHVMPVSEFEGNSSWGYNPNFYFAPDKYYGRANDLKKFIDECHQREILVFNDLVLNHAFYSNSMARMYWNTADNKPSNDNPWFNPDHKMIADMAGWWGADWNHESEHTQVMVDRILDYWLQEFKFDGFRFDFTKGFGQSAPDANDPWASSYDQDRIDLLIRMIDGMKARNPGSIAIFEHLANSNEDAVLADHGILMWSGVEHHNKMKEFMLGWNGEDIYSSGIHTAQGFTYANWMSYMESHDEERQAYEVMQYGKGNANYTTENIVDRLKLGAVFNLLFPGPRMLWQFEELAYDISIDFNGRTGEKPVKWEYYFDSHRKELWRLMAQLLHLRNEYNIYQGAVNYGNIGSTDGVGVPRYMKLNDGNGKHIIIVANLDPDASHIVSPTFDSIGTWYRFNGDENVDGTTFTINSPSETYNLLPNETFVFTNFDPGWNDACENDTACCVKTVHTWIGGVGIWHDKNNWDTNSIPKPCDMVIIPGSSEVLIESGKIGYAHHVLTLEHAILKVDGELRLLKE